MGTVAKRLPRVSLNGPAIKASIQGMIAAETRYDVSSMLAFFFRRRKEEKQVNRLHKRITAAIAMKNESGAGKNEVAVRSVQPIKPPA